MGLFQNRRNSLLLLALLLGIHEGYLALWTPEDPQPLVCFSVPSGSLPPADQIRLRQGIVSDYQQTLMALLEDFGVMDVKGRAPS